jgi:hypothetical protein
VNGVSIECFQYLEFKRKRSTPVGCQSGWSHFGRRLPTLHIHTDESGNFDFSPKGSRYYVFAAAWTYHPAALAANLSALRFEQIKTPNGSEEASNCGSSGD